MRDDRLEPAQRGAEPGRLHRVLREPQRRLEAGLRQRAGEREPDEVTALQQQLQEKVAAARGKGDLIKDVILAERRAIELEIRQAEQQLRKAKLKKRERIDQLGVKLRNFCTLPGPAIILIIAIILAARRSMLRRYYIRHTTES